MLSSSSMLARKMNPDNTSLSSEPETPPLSRLQIRSQLQAALELQKQSGNSGDILGEQVTVPSLGHLAQPERLGLSALRQSLALPDEILHRDPVQEQIDTLGSSSSSLDRHLMHQQRHLEIDLAFRVLPEREPIGPLERGIHSPHQKRGRLSGPDLSCGLKLPPAREQQPSWAKTGATAQKLPLPSLKQSGKRVRCPSLKAYRRAWNSISRNAGKLPFLSVPREKWALTTEIFSRAIQSRKVNLYAMQGKESEIQQARKTPRRVTFFGV